VQAADGEAYTRAGGFEVQPDGTLTGAAGLPVVGDGGPITIPAGAQVTIAADGTITAQGAAGGPQNIGRLKLVNPPVGELQKSADGLLRMRGGEPAGADDTVRVNAGAIEGSNVSVVEAMVSMIASARQYETHMKLLQSADQNDQRAAQLLGPAR
jgi:flagellar basal-body rod protein FlgF